MTQAVAEPQVSRSRTDKPETIRFNIHEGWPATGWRTTSPRSALDLREPSSVLSTGEWPESCTSRTTQGAISRRAEGGGGQAALEGKVGEAMGELLKLAESKGFDADKILGG